jgi:hypothetical protein
MKMRRQFCFFMSSCVCSSWRQNIGCNLSRPKRLQGRVVLLSYVIERKEGRRMAAGVTEIRGYLLRLIYNCDCDARARLR